MVTDFEVLRYLDEQTIRQLLSKLKLDSSDRWLHWLGMALRLSSAESLEKVASCIDPDHRPQLRNAARMEVPPPLLDICVSQAWVLFNLNVLIIENRRRESRIDAPES